MIFTDFTSLFFPLKKYPRDIDECMRGFDTRRWHESVWRIGYMSQMGGDVNVSVLAKMFVNVSIHVLIHVHF